MDFTGSELTVKRNFYTQTGNFSFGMSCSVDNTTGTYHFGVSGAQGSVDFKLESGRIYYKDQFIHTYQSFRDFFIEAQFFNGKTNVIKDASPLAYGIDGRTGQFDYFYFSRANASLGASFGPSISGDTFPAYSVTNQGYLYNSGQTAVTGYFANQSIYPIRVFDSNILVTQPYEFGKLVGNIAPSTSGIFAYTGDFNTFDLTQPILTTFSANFGQAQVNFSIVDARGYDHFVLFQDVANFDFDTTGILNRDVFYTNYSGGIATDAFDANFQLSYVSGSGGLKTFTGSWDFLTGVDSNHLVSLKQPGQFSSTMISGSGFFPPNSSVNFQVVHNIIDSNPDGCHLLITGVNVVNAISRNLSN